MKFTVLLLMFISLVSITNVIFAEQVDESNSQQNDEKSKDIESHMQNNTVYKVKINELTKQKFKNDIKELLHDYDKTERYQKRSDEIKIEYNQFFENVIEQARIDSETRYLTSNEVSGAKKYIFYETVKDEKHKKLEESSSVKRLDVSFLEWFGIQIVYAACPITTNPHYKQVTIDITGGIFNSHVFNGNNTLYLVSYKDNTRTCERTYTLYFYDEDHPNLDDLYDGIRQILYGRTHDIEIFSIINNNQIKFDNTWSSSNDFDCVDLLNRGCHNTTTKPYSPGQSVYVSNTWNHMMDTSDTNISHAKTSVP